MPLAPQRHARAAIMQLLAQMLGMVAGYIIAVVLARELGPAVFGAYSLVYSLLLTSEIIGRLGVPQALTKLVAEKNNRRDEIEATGILTGIAVYLVIFALFTLASPWLASLMGLPGQGWYFRLAAIDIPFYGMFFVIVAILNGRQEFHLAALATAVYAASRIIGVLVLVLIGVSFEGALLANAIASVVGVGVAIAGAGGIRLSCSRAHFHRLRQLAAPLSLRGVANQIMTGMGLWSLGLAGASITGEAKGLYAAANSVARLPVIVSLGLSAIVLASIAAALGRGDRSEARQIVKGAGRALFIVLLPSTGLLVMEAETVMRLLFDDRYAAGGPILAVLVIGQGFAFTFVMILSGALVAASRPQAALLCGLAGVIVAGVGIAALLPWLGIMGAAIGSSTGSLACAVATGIMTSRVIGPWIDVRGLVRLSVATSPVIAAAWWVETDGLMFFVELSALGSLLLLLMFSLKVLRLDDVRLIFGRAHQV